MSYASVLCVRPRSAEPMEAWSMRWEDIWDTSSFYGKYDITGRSLLFQWHTFPRHVHSFKEKGRHKHLWNNFQGRLVYICTCSTTSTAPTRTKKNNILKMSWRPVPMQSNFYKANGASVDRVQKNMVHGDGSTRKGLGPHCDKDGRRSSSLPTIQHDIYCSSQFSVEFTSLSFVVSLTSQ